jgi:hypothetical protein
MSSENVKMWKSNELPTKHTRQNPVLPQIIANQFWLNFVRHIYIIIYNIYIYLPQIYTHNFVDILNWWIYLWSSGRGRQIAASGNRLAPKFRVGLDESAETVETVELLGRP